MMLVCSWNEYSLLTPCVERSGRIDFQEFHNIMAGKMVCIAEFLRLNQLDGYEHS